MTSTFLSSNSYLTYLTDYIDALSNRSDAWLAAHLLESYFDEIENHHDVVLAQWLSEQDIDADLLAFVEQVGQLNCRMASMIHLDRAQSARVEQLLCNAKHLRLIQTILRNLLKSSLRHNERFLSCLTGTIDAHSLLKPSRIYFERITGEILRSVFYRDYLTELRSSSTDVKHRFFIGAVTRLAPVVNDPVLNRLYSHYLVELYQPQIPNDTSLHYCTLGVLSQLQGEALIDDQPCLSVLTSLFFHASSSMHDETKKSSFLDPVLTLITSLCAQSKTVACFLNTDALIHVLLNYVTRRDADHLDIRACLVLGHMISEQQLNQLGISYKLAMKFIDLLLHSNYNREAILSSLLSLVIHQSMQAVLVQTYQLTHIIEISSTHSTCFDIIWKLSFHPEVCQQLIERHADFLRHLSTLATVAAAHGILENVQTHNQPRLPPNADTSYDLSIVSSPVDRSMVHQIETYCHKHKIRVGTIEQASSVLLCMSEESKHDSACQAAVRKTLLDCKSLVLCIVRQPCRLDDWFSTLAIQDKQLLDTIELGVERIVVRIRSSLRLHQPQVPIGDKRSRLPVSRSNGSSNAMLPAPPSPSETLVSMASSLSDMPTKRTLTWTNQDVLEWCRNNNLDGFVKLLALYDGRSLLSLARISRQNAPHTIINQLRTDCRKHGLKLSFTDFIRFQTALDGLLHIEQQRTKTSSIGTSASQYVYRGKATNRK